MKSKNKYIIPILLFAAASAIYSCSSTAYDYDSDIRNKYWKLTELNGDTVIVSGDQREPHIIFKLNDDTCRGSAGCNNFSGSYEITGDSVKIGMLAVTRKFCDSLMDQESKFLEVLQQGGQFIIKGETLSLLSNNNVTARFKAIYF